MSRVERYRVTFKPGPAVWVALAIIGFLGWAIFLAWGEDAARTWRALLISFIFFTPLSCGLVTWSAIVVAANGSWPGEAERLTWRALGFLPSSFLILTVLWIGSPQWAPWYGADLKGGWLSNNFLFVRDIVALTVFWVGALWYVRRRKESRQGAMVPAVVLIVIYCLVFTLLGFDLVMALAPMWHSTIFGGYFFITGLYIGVLFWALLAALRPEFGPMLRHDIGNLIITFCILGFYFMFMQLLTIWYENLPHETIYLVARMNYPGWDIVSYVLVLLLFVSPIALFLSKGLKMNRKYQGIVAFVLLAGFWFERWWLVTPVFEPRVQFGAVEIAGALGTAGLLGLGIALASRRLPQLPVEPKSQGEAPQ